MSISLIPATRQNRTEVLQYVRAYHEFEGVRLSDEQRIAAIDELIGSDELGRIFLIERDKTTIGYIAVCFGFSIEFVGRDAFIDEMFIVSGYRGLGYGREVLKQVKQELQSADIKALHLEVARDNDQAQRLYRSVGFESREKYYLMSALLADSDAQ
ncbi:GNAT family N-acetyltransferase [Aidingimonas lacisalsi]|uniref:GNAT family N-acetyltransferase n=1 Tax=Aidingimonas lacisalsi TaxID=2604086 RepID=UPI0013759003|nr:GNAT family N-acetyltransferase [Aidingimonas lacisalsi]